MKKLFIPGLILLLFLLTTCKSKDYGYLYNTYRGSQVVSKNVAGTDVDMAAEIIVDVEPAGVITINGVLGSYEILDDKEDYVTLLSQVQKQEVAVTQTFQYLKNDSVLVMLGDTPEKNITLYTEPQILERKLNAFAEVPLTADLSKLSQNQKEMLKVLFRAADVMDDLFWKEAYPGNRDSLFASTDNETLKKLFKINYGPWERLNGDKPLLEKYGIKPAGANFYPVNMTVEEFENFDDPNKSSQYTLIRRDDSGNLKSVWYHDGFSEKILKASSLLKQAADLADDPGFKKYLTLRADALLSDNYYASDAAWMQMKNNDIDFVVGPIENYEDKLFNYKAAHEAFILIKDRDWSNKLKKIADMLPQLQRELPVPEKFKKTVPSTNSDLNVYDAVYYAGDCNAGSKTIAINLPNDPSVREKYGSRKLQLKNAIRYKFEKILVPISNVLISEDQRRYIDFDAFFENTMFHEVAHGLGVDYTVNGKGEVREALKDTYSSIEEGKADILGLYIVTKLAQAGELGDKDLMTNYVTFMAGIFRSVRFGASSAHGVANMIRFYYFQEAGAFTRDEDTGTYRVNFEKMKDAITNLSREIITIQGTGDYDAAKNLIRDKGYVKEQLQKDLDKLKDMNIPVDIIFDQGPSVLGLE
ncbi:MAG TPA: Zn-dependent hydrolase [Bacteroidales bacterium]|nr:Zn-dependent hydrolase [Bacteroidales bacterium]